MSRNEFLFQAQELVRKANRLGVRHPILRTVKHRLATKTHVDSKYIAALKRICLEKEADRIISSKDGKLL